MRLRCDSSAGADECAVECGRLMMTAYNRLAFIIRGSSHLFSYSDTQCSCILCMSLLCPALVESRIVVSLLAGSMKEGYTTQWLSLVFRQLSTITIMGNARVCLGFPAKG